MMGKQTKEEMPEQKEDAGLALPDSSGLGSLTCMVHVSSGLEVG